MHPIYELKNIAYFMPQYQKEQIERWIDKYIYEAHIEIRQARPFDEKHKEYCIENAKHKLGKNIADNSNMYPTFEKRGDERICRMSALCFKSPYGHGYDKSPTPEGEKENEKWTY